MIQRRVRSASLSSLLWALVLIKMLTPPLLSIPVLGIPNLGSLIAIQFKLPSKLAPPIGQGMVDGAVEAGELSLLLSEQEMIARW